MRWDRALRELEIVLEKCERLRESPDERCAAFVKSVSTAASGMHDSVSADRRITPRQALAIGNWISGLDKWLRGESR